MSGLHIARSCEIPVRKKTERGWGSLVTTQHIWVKLSGTKIYTLHSPTLSNIYYPSVSASAALWINSQSLEDAHHVHLNVGHLVYLHFGHHDHLHVDHHIHLSVGPRNVILKLCEVSETLTEWKSESVMDLRTDGLTDWLASLRSDFSQRFWQGSWSKGRNWRRREGIFKKGRGYSNEISLPFHQWGE